MRKASIIGMLLFCSVVTEASTAELTCLDVGKLAESVEAARQRGVSLKQSLTALDRFKDLTPNNKLALQKFVILIYESKPVPPELRMVQSWEACNTTGKRKPY
jgi:hypothetical protein